MPLQPQPVEAYLYGGDYLTAEPVMMATAAASVGERRAGQTFENTAEYLQSRTRRAAAGVSREGLLHAYTGEAPVTGRLLDLYA